MMEISPPFLALIMDTLFTAMGLCFTFYALLHSTQTRSPCDVRDEIRRLSSNDHQKPKLQTFSFESAIAAAAAPKPIEQLHKLTSD